MRIGIDMRMAGTQHGGIGRYVFELARHVLKSDKDSEYCLFYNRDSDELVRGLKSKSQGKTN